MIQTVLKIKVTQNQTSELVQAFKYQMVSALAEHGLMECKLYQEVGNETVFCYVEKWQATDDLEYQIRSNRYNRLLALMEIAAEPPSLEFQSVSQTLGLDYLQAVRNGAGAKINE